ncbi:Rieske (2Fe-2S) protein [Salipaludibacillus daqingensis]|uniref:Rieske (2Fe-2S) protein n=1 Tax=Salipaludibacillus daqingensis TaxID=3041001 RepID=UPI0024746174|nr:Rieske 2Fe-2S domain-containing protein [Salipaludibacillus daqingensis]
MDNWIHAGSLDQLKEKKTKLIKGAIVVFLHEENVYALDNRCPHMGFPLHMGSLCDGILTCHWHHARFDVCSGGTLDPWADDVPSYEIKIEDGDVWVNHVPGIENQVEQYKQQLRKGLEQNLGLVIAKAVVSLLNANVREQEIVQIGMEFGTKYRSSGWGPGLTILTCMANVLPKLDSQGRIQALFQGLSHVARDCAGHPPQHLIGPLSGFDGNLERLKDWYRNCIEVRDTQGSERIILTAIEKQMSISDLNGMMMTAATDHFYMDVGHTLDFHNKAFESLTHTGNDMAKQILPSLTPLFANAARSEEQHRWQSPIDLVMPLHEAFSTIEGISLDFSDNAKAFDEKQLFDHLLSDNPLTMIEEITTLLKDGVNPIKVAQVTTLAAAERIVRFHIQNDFSDWNTVLHTFTHAHAVHESLRRSNEDLIVRAIYHGAVSIYLDRFLNIPSTKRPVAKEETPSLDCQDLLELLNKQQQVNQSADWVVQYLHHGGDKQQLFHTLGLVLLREDAKFHSYQMFEAACAEYDRWEKESSAFAEHAKETMLIAMTRYLAAHAPTARELPHIGTIAWRLNRGEKLFEEA